MFEKAPSKSNEANQRQSKESGLNESVTHERLSEQAIQFAMSFSKHELSQKTIMQMQVKMGNKKIAQLYQFIQSQKKENQLEREKIDSDQDQDSSIQIGIQNTDTDANLPSDEVIQKMGVSVWTDKQKDGSIIITKVFITSRFPTPLKNQGDHTVAVGFLENAFNKFCTGKTHKEVAGRIGYHMIFLDEEIKTKFKLIDKMVSFDISSVYDEIEKYKKLIKSGDTFELNQQLSIIIEMYMRLWNKRIGAAYDRKDKFTFGGGDEKEAISYFRDTAEEDFKIMEGSKEIQKAFDFNLLGDNPKGKEKKERIVTTAKNLTHGIELGMMFQPDLEYDYNEFGTHTVKEYCKNQNIDKETEEKIDEHVFEFLRGKDEDDDSSEYESSNESDEKDYMDTTDD